MSVTTDVIRAVWHDKEGVAIDIGPDADALGLVRISNRDTKSVEYFGKVDICFSPDLARAIGEAMILAADEVERMK